MKHRILAGCWAALAALALPLLICGMAKKQPETTTHLPTETPQLAAKQEETRKVREIIVHKSAPVLEKKDNTVVLTVEVAGDPTEMTLEDYLTGVLMGEMPASFELEALKAQAVAARTYTLRRMEGGGVLSDDPSVCQAFIPPEKASEKLGENWEELLKKLRTAVRETDREVLTYNGALIAATYFSCSGGRTEPAQAVWGSDIPYLVSVESPGEEEASSYESKLSVPLEEFLETLEIEGPGVSSVTYTDGGGVDTMVIGGRTVKGTQMRKLFGLKSTCFSMEITEDTVEFSVLGHGHRVGMSQYGAQAMAEAGKGYRDILAWYYQGVSIEEYDGE